MDDDDDDADYYGVGCELDAYTLDTCTMTSPQHVPNATVSTPCLIVEYYMSSDDVVLSAEFIVNGATANSVTFDPDLTINYITLTDLPSMQFSVKFDAQRLVTSSDTLEYVRVESVKLGQCSLLCEWCCCGQLKTN